MTLSASELQILLAILDKIDEGKASPGVPGQVGRFLRQYRSGRFGMDRILEANAVRRRADAAVSGGAVGTIELFPLLEFRITAHSRRFGKVADTLAICEELGSVLQVNLWLNAGVASMAFESLRHTGLRLHGDYRWRPPARLTTGEATLEPLAVRVQWQEARCLKSVADDLPRPPHALEYVLDYRLGPPGLKHFRCVCASVRGTAVHVFDRVGRSKTLTVTQALEPARVAFRYGDLFSLLIYREPWSSSWTIIEAAIVDSDAIEAHADAWEDFQKELHASSSSVPGDPSALVLNSNIGVRGEEHIEDTPRKLLPVARDLLRWVHGLA